MQDPQQGTKVGAPPIGLGHWSLYFLFKIFLSLAGYLVLNPLYNLALATFLLLPLRRRWAQTLRNLMVFPVAVALLYRESMLPPFHRMLSEAGLLVHFDWAYLGELAARLFNPDLVAGLVLLLSAYFLLSRYLHLGVLVVGLLIYQAVPWDQWFRGTGMVRTETQAVAEPVAATAAAKATHPASLQEQIDRYLESFYERERRRQVSIPAPVPDDVPFDILFIHVCSLAWDDIAYARLEGELPKFDLLFRNFNSAASYSGPAAIRVLRSTCGQTRHSDLYRDAPAQCYLFRQLESDGFESQLMLNHDGHFDDFIGVIHERGWLEADPMPLAGLAPALRSFDGSPIYDDGEVLARWLNRRQGQTAPRVAVYYNTITLHDGNRYVDKRARLNSQENFRLRMQGLFGELRTFFRRLQASERRILVVMIPEHGAAIRGDKLQVAGLREIPSPAITLVPVGIRLFGPEIGPPEEPIVIHEPTSYLAVTDLIARLIAANPFGPAGYRPDRLVDGILETPFVAENGDTLVVRYRGAYYLRLDASSQWMPYTLGK